MKLTITQSQGSALVTILHLDGTMDGTNYMNLVEEAQKVYDAGARDLILDLSKLGYISSAGLSALHRVALLFRGEKFMEMDEGWAAYHAIDRDRDRGVQQHVKMFVSTGKVLEVIEMVGFTAIFEIYTDIHRAEDSFFQPATAIEVSLQ